MPNHMGGHAVPRSFRVRIGTHSPLPIFDSDGVASSGVCTVVPRRSFKVRGSVMMRFYSLLALALGFVIVGCGEETTGPIKGGPFGAFGLWSTSTNPTYGQFYITAQTFGHNGTPHYISGGQIFTATSHPLPAVDGGTMTAGDLGITWDSGHGYYAVGQPTFGAVSDWGLSGNSTYGIPSFSDEMYVPSVIKLTAPVGPNTTLSKANDISVQWNVDPNNSQGVLVGVRYDGATSMFVDSTMPYFVYEWHDFTADDGSYTIPAAALDTIPVGGYVAVTVARGASKEVGTTNKRFHIYGYSIGETLFKVTN